MAGNVYIGNRGGLPFITVTPVASTTDVRLPLPNHLFRHLGVKGKIILQLTTVATSTTTTLPVLVETNGDVKPLLNSTGAALTVADVNTLLTMEIVFDKVAGTLTLTNIV